RDLVEDRLELLLGRLPGRPPPAPARHRVRDRVARPPGSVGELEEIGAGVGAAVEVTGLDAAGGSGIARRRDGGEGEYDADRGLSHDHLLSWPEDPRLIPQPPRARQKFTPADYNSGSHFLRRLIMRATLAAIVAAVAALSFASR